MSKTISTILSMRDNMSGGILKVSKNVSGMTSQMKRASQQSATFANNAKKNFEKVGDKVVKLGAAMAVLAAGFIIKVGFEGMKELDAAAAKVKSIAMGTLEKKDIKTGLLKTSSDTGISTTELGDTQYNAISSGVSSKNSLDAAVISAKLAKAGFTDSNSALKVLMATMNVYGLTGSAAMSKISDKMLVVQNLGVITVAEMAESMGSVTPVAQAAGASIDELDAGMISLTKNGIKAEEASVQMKGIFTSIIKPSTSAAKEAKALGINFSAAGLKSKGFAKFMAEVKEKTGGSTEKMAKLFGNVRALTGALVLSGAGFDDFNTGLVAVKNSSGMTDKAFKIMADTLGGRIDKLKNRVKNIATGIMDNTGGKLTEMVSKITNKLTELETNGSIQKFVDKAVVIVQKLFDAISKIFAFLVEHKEAIENIAIAFASFYVAIKIMKVLKGVILGIQIAMGLLNGTLALTPLGWILIAIAAVIFVGIMLYKNWDKIKAASIILWKTVKTAFSGMWKSITSICTSIWTATVSIFKSILDSITGVATGIWASITSVFTSIRDTIVNIATSIWTTITSVFTSVWSTITSITTSIWNTIKSVFTAIWNVIVAILTPILTIFEAIFKLILAVVILVLYAIWTKMKAVWTSITLTIITVLTTIWNVIKSVWTSITLTIITVLTAIWGVIVSVWTSITLAITTVLTAIWNVITMVWTSITTTITTAVTAVWTVISSVFSTIFGVVSGIFTSVWGVVVSIWTSISTTISGVVTGIWTTVTVGFNSAKDSIVGIFTSIKDTVFNVFGSIWSGIKGIINNGIGLINGFIHGVNKVVGAANKVPGVNIGLVGDIPTFAKGTNSAPGGLSLVGEEGPEFINLRKGTSVTTADKTNKILNNSGKDININIKIDSFIGDEDFADMIGERIGSKIQLALGNM